MSVSEQDRHVLFAWLEEAMGPDRAATMMDLLPPLGWGDIATKADVVALKADLVALGDRLDGRMDELERRMDGFERRMDGFERRMDRFGDQLAGIDGVLRTQTRTFVSWLLVSQTSVAAIVSAVITITSG